MIQRHEGGAVVDPSFNDPWPRLHATFGEKHVILLLRHYTLNSAIEACSVKGTYLYVQVNNARK
jgi:hypothetical protein